MFDFIKKGSEIERKIKPTPSEGGREEIRIGDRNSDKNKKEHRNKQM